MTRGRFVGVTVLLIGLAFILVLLGRSPRGVSAIPAPAPGRLSVITTTSVLASLTEKVTRGEAAVRVLLPPGADPHEVALRPADATALGTADVLVANGLGLEIFLDDARKLLPSQARLVVASEGVPVLPSFPGGPPDPHLWLDPRRASAIVANIARGLAAADPARRERYFGNAAAYAERLTVLEGELKEELQAVARRDFVAVHPAWTYFAERFGLRTVATIQERPDEDPTAERLAAITRRVRETGVRVLIAEPQHPSPHATALASDLGLTTVEANPEGGSADAEGYENFLRETVAAFARALRSP